MCGAGSRNPVMSQPGLAPLCTQPSCGVQCVRLVGLMAPFHCLARGKEEPPLLDPVVPSKRAIGQTIEKVKQCLAVAAVWRAAGPHQATRHGEMDEVGPGVPLPIPCPQSSEQTPGSLRESSAEVRIAQSK